MNGGAAVAMLAFLQAIWTDNPSLSRYVVIGTAVFSFGVALAGIVQLIRYSASFNLQEGKRNRWQVLRCSYLAAAYGSIVVFIIGVGVIVCGGWCALR